MIVKQTDLDFPKVETAIYRLALSLDAFLLNGIQYGVLQRAVFGDFLEKAIANLLRDLATLDEIARQAATSDRVEIKETLSALTAKSQQLMDLVTELGFFRSLPLPKVRSVVAEIPHIRAECVHFIQELEDHFRTPNRFYESRPANSTASVDGFLANLETMFVQEWRVNGK